MTKLTRDQEEIAELIVELHELGRRQLLSENRLGAYAKEAARATRRAASEPELEVRLTCHSLAIAVFMMVTIPIVFKQNIELYKVASGFADIDNEKTAYPTIEFTNGSCIKLLVADSGKKVTN